MGSQGRDPESSGTPVLSRFLLAIFLLGLVGAGAELLLLGHYEDSWQWAPIALLVLALAVVPGVLFRPGPATFQLLRAVAVLLALGGAAGLILHFRGNAEFEREMVPSLGGFELAWEALRGATPALAPGFLIQLGLLGWAATLYHPAYRPGRLRNTEDEGEEV